MEVGDDENRHFFRVCQCSASAPSAMRTMSAAI
jgi:hypothetical protein